MACGGFFSPSYFLLLFCSLLFSLPPKHCRVMCHMTPGHTGLPHKTRTTETGGRCFRPIFVMHTCPLRRNSSPAVDSVDMGRVYIHWRRLCGVTPCCREICKENSHWTPPITSSPPPTTTVFWNFNPSWVFFRYPLIGSATSNTMACTTIIHRPFYVQPSLLPVPIFLQDFFLWLLPPLLGVEPGWVTLCSFSPTPSLLTFVTSICRSFRSSTSLNFSQNSFHFSLFSRDEHIVPVGHNHSCHFLFLCPMLSSPSFQRRGSETTSSSFILRVFLLSPQLQSPFPAKPHPSNLPTMQQISWSHTRPSMERRRCPSGLLPSFPPESLKVDHHRGPFILLDHVRVQEGCFDVVGRSLPLVLW